MAGTDWQVGPVLKDKLGSQGTLFRGGTKYSSDKRYPKGYTPERQQEVADAVVRPSVKNYTNKPQEVNTGRQSMYYKDRKVRGSGSMSDDNMYYQSNKPTRDLVENIARSTVPLQHLQGVQFRTEADSHLTRPGAVEAGISIAGHYDRKGDAMSNGQPVIRIKTGQEGNLTPIHEIGHHVSHNIEGNEYAQHYHTGSEQGAEEGRADSYSVEHARNQKGQRVTALRRYPSELQGADPQRRLNFESSYAKAREHIPYPDDTFAKYRHDNLNAFQQGKEAESRGETLFNTWDNGDGTVALHEPSEQKYRTGPQIGWSKKGTPRG